MRVEGALMRLARRWFPALVTVLLFFVPQLAALDSVRNRYFMFWGRRDTLAICLSILLLTAFSVGVSALADRSRSHAIQAVRDTLFLIFFGLAVAVNLLGLVHIRVLMGFLDRNRGLTTAGLWAVLALFAAGWIVCLLRWRPVLARAAVTACFVLSPLYLTVLGPALFWTRWDAPPDPIPPPGAHQRPGTPVYVLLFDEWSYTRATGADRFGDQLPHLQALQAQSFYFRRALSPANSTYRSLPETLFQTADFESLPNVFVPPGDGGSGRAGQSEYVSSEPSDGPGAPQSLFALATGYGYMTYMLGFYLPYRNILGRQVKVCRAYADYPKGSSFPGRMLLVTLQNPQYWRVPFVTDLWKRMYAAIFSRNWVRLNRRLTEDLYRVIDSAPRRAFVFLHHPAPHAPFVFNPDGTYRGPFPVHTGPSHDIDGDIMAGTAEDYARSLAYLDHVVGGIVARMKQQGIFDDALLIVTSDHGWRIDPAADPSTDAVRHVPLLIKLPGQRTAHTVDASFRLGDLRPIIEQVMRGGLTEDGAVAMLSKVPPQPLGHS